MQSQPDAPTTREAVCPAHGPFTAMNLSAGRIWSRCPACSQAHEAARVAEEAAKKAAIEARALDSRIRASGLQGRFLRATFATYQATTPAQRQVLATCRAFAEEFDPATTTGGLWLIGPPGTGKSHLGAAVVSYLVHRGLDAHIFAVHEIMRMARERIGTKRPESRLWDSVDGYYEPPSARTETVEGLIERLAGASLLVLDEIGVSRGSDWETEQLFALVDARYKAELPTVLASNLTAAQLKTDLGHRVYDRLREGAQLVPMDWPSHRGAKQ